MNNINPSQNEHSPMMQFIFLVLLSVAGALVFSLVGMAIVAATSGLQVLLSMMEGQITDENLGAFRMLQLVSSVGMFLAPPIFLAYIQQKKPSAFYTFKTPGLAPLALVLVIIFVSMPLMEWTIDINQKMHLPAFLKDLEDWMRRKEDEAMALTYRFLSIKSGWDVAINFVIIALVPAVAEELMFRGAIQRILKRMFANPHVAIWATAIIFSAIHMQFFGFLPRMLLGAAFGYIYYWSKNLWYAIFAHFINNGYAVAVAWYLQANNKPLDQAEQTMPTAWYVYLLSAVFTAGAFLYFKKITEKNG